MYQYVLFDLDGTLTDPKEGICKSVQYALHKAGIEETDLDKLEPFIGPPLTDSFKEFYGMNDEEATEVVCTYRERFSVIGLYENEVYPGIYEMLRTLQEKGCRLAVASSKPTVFVEKILKFFKLKSYFDVIVGSELDGRRVKKEEVVNEALLQLYKGIDNPENKKKTVMVGDRKFDVSGARDANVSSIAVAYGYGVMEELEAAKPDAIAHTVKELTSLLLEDGKPSEWMQNYSQAERKAKEEIPKLSFFRAIYMIIPFVIYYLVMLVLMTVGVTFVDTLKTHTEESTLQWLQQYSKTISIGISAIAMLGGAAILYFLFRKREPIPERLLKEKKGSNIILIPAMGAMLALSLNYLIGELARHCSASQSALTEASFDAAIPFGAGVVLYILVSPIAEEMVFRWMIFGRINRILPTALAVLTSSLFFGLYHGNLIQGIYAFLMALVLAFLYHISKTFLVPVLFHMAANAAIYLNAMATEELKKIVISPVLCVIYMIVSIGILFWFKDQCTEK